VARAFAWALMAVLILCGIGFLLGGVLLDYTLMTVAGLGLLVAASIAKPK
jgi:hypothetical protein